jgi:magnesium transporter
MITVYRFRVGSGSVEWLTGDAISSQIQELRETTDTVWIDACQPSDAEEALLFALQPVHPLTREDMTRERRDPRHQPHLPKVEEFSDYLFVVVNPLHPLVGAAGDRSPDAPANGLIVTQLSAVLTHTRLTTHHLEPLDAITELRARLERHVEHGQRGPDYLFHLVLDAMVDEYAPVLDRVTDALESLETQVLMRPERSMIKRLLRLKRHIIGLRKTLVHEREVLARLSRGEFSMIDARETVYYRNVYDHLVRFNELIEGARDMASDLMESHLSSTSNRLNEIMKVLTMISTIVLPMTLVAGIYGMNFDFMPELHWRLGYGWALGLMLLSGLLPLAYFKWRKWF